MNAIVGNSCCKMSTIINKNIKTRPSASCSESHVDMYSVFWFFPKQDLYYVNNIIIINNFAALRLNLRVNAATLYLSLPLYLLKLNIENELNDALPFDGDLASMRTFKSNQNG